MSTGTPYRDLDKIPGGGLRQSLGGNIYGNLTIICSRDLGESCLSILEFIIIPVASGCYEVM